MKIAARCRHCGALRGWVEVDVLGGKIVEPSASYPCSLSPTGMCERLIETPGQRMTRENAQGASRRIAGMNGSGYGRKR